MEEFKMNNGDRFREEDEDEEEEEGEEGEIPGVNFINILHTNFSYERCFSTYM